MPVIVTPGDLPELISFLRDVDVTLSGLDSSTVRVWIERNEAGVIVASTGFELSENHEHALIRSVAVRPSAQRVGEGTRLAPFALGMAAVCGARRAWLFSRRSGPFWRRLGFEGANRDHLALGLGNTYQVRLFVESGQLDREFAWSRALGSD